MVIIGGPWSINIYPGYPGSVPKYQLLTQAWNHVQEATWYLRLALVSTL